VQIVASTIGQDFRDGRLVLRAEVVRYLEKAGVVVRPQENAETGPTPKRGDI
jgi:hypothetical protein